MVQGINGCREKKFYGNLFFWTIKKEYYLCNPKSGNAALVKGLRRLPFTEESRVRIPYVVQKQLPDPAAVFF